MAQGKLKMSRRLLISMFVAALAGGACNSVGGRSTPPAELTMTAAPGPTTPPAAATVTSSAAGTCFYVWASHDLPELSQKLQGALQAANATMSGSASAYGEDCVYADGHRDFSAMETDFRIRMKVVDFKDEETLGNGIARTMSVIDTWPTADLAGGRAGRVDFSFYTADSQELRVTVDVGKYHGVAGGIGGAQLFRLFYVSP
jgi:hypothetical protein